MSPNNISTLWPHTTQSPLTERLYQQAMAKSKKLDNWFEQQELRWQPPIYSSVDLRHSGFKLAPVDTNLFPAGFNQLNQKALTRATTLLTHYLDRYYPNTQHIALVGESHTRNGFYLDNLATLQTLFIQTGRTISVVMLTLDPDTTLPLVSANGSHLMPLMPSIVNDQWHINTIPVDLIILNTDLTSGIPTQLQHIHTPIIPSPHLGWFRRRKSQYFNLYNQLAEQFAAILDMDPFYFTTAYRPCHQINLSQEADIERLKQNSYTIFEQLERHYAHYQIKDRPYLFIKADNGTYGMGIMTIDHPDELNHLNKKIRNKMATIKEGVENSDLLIQEGISTIEQLDGHSAEPMMYLIAGQPTACIFRINTERDAKGHLNSRGMYFNRHVCELLAPHQSLSFKLIARLATLAAAWENEFFGITITAPYHGNDSVSLPSRI
jgi:glutamate--cysteine ligase